MTFTVLELFLQQWKIIYFQALMQLLILRFRPIQYSSVDSLVIVVR